MLTYATSWKLVLRCSDLVTIYDDRLKGAILVWPNGSSLVRQIVHPVFFMEGDKGNQTEALSALTTAEDKVADPIEGHLP